MARKAGVPYRTWQSWEQGEALPEADALLKLAKVGVSVEYLLGIVREETASYGPPPVVERDESRLLDFFRELPEHAKRDVVAYAYRQTLDLSGKDPPEEKREAGGGGQGGAATRRPTGGGK